MLDIINISDKDKTLCATIHNIADGLEFIRVVKFPIYGITLNITNPNFSGVVHNKEEYIKLCTKGLKVGDNPILFVTSM